MLEWIASINSEMQNFKILESLQEATPEEISSYKGRVLPCKMVFLCQEIPDATTYQRKQDNQGMEGEEQD
eukprot:12460142-Prorocentrum_lima.AAC.1